LTILLKTIFVSYSGDKVGRKKKEEEEEEEKVGRD